MRVVIPVMMALALYLVNMSPSLILISVVDGGIKCNPIATKSNIRIHTYIQPEVRARGQSRSIQPEVRAGARAPSINTASQPDAAVPVSVSLSIHTYFYGCNWVFLACLVFSV